MGMYTELIFGAELKKDTPEEVIDNLKYMVGEKELPEPPEEVKDFWFVLRGASYYFGVDSAVKELWFNDTCESWHLSSRSNIKNYGEEIEAFLAWIKPYIEHASGGRDFYAIVTYEEAEEPTIYYLDEEVKLDQ